MRRAALLLLLGVAACAPRLPPPSPAAAAVAAVCRVGPDGGRPAAAPAFADRTVADRGIGGTGKPVATARANVQLDVRTADRGIGGTGIIGVVTGFGSLCVAGERVALPEDVPVRVDGQPGDLDGLRAGQVTAVAASDVAGSLRARTVDVLHVVIGPVDAVAAGTMTVAGQVVQLAGANGSATGARPGVWVAVSGLRRADGAVAATRVDPAAPGAALVRGELVRAGGRARIGGLGVQLPGAADPPGGWSVTATGPIRGGVLVAESVRLDAASGSPDAYFGSDIRRYVIEGYITAAPGGLLLNGTFVPGPGLEGVGSSGRRIVALELDAGGRLRTAAPRFGARREPPRGEIFSRPLPGTTLSPGSMGAPDDEGRRPGGGMGPRRR